MIERLTKEQQASARRQLLTDVVWAVCNDTLRQLHRDRRTTLTPVEIYLSARHFCDCLLNLTDIDEGIEYEMDDLETEAEGTDDAILVMMLASVQLQAISKRRVGADIPKIIRYIYERCESHALFFPLLQGFSHKEEARWLEGKRIDLMKYELREIEKEGGGSMEIKQFLDSLVDCSDKFDPETIKGNLLFLNRYNIDHQHAFDKEILSLFEKLGIKSTLLMNVEEYVAVKNVETEIGKVENGGIGTNNNYN